VTVRKLIGPPSIWTEPFTEHVLRWHRSHPEEERDRIGSASIAAQKATERGLRVLAYSKLQPGREILSARMWEARWEPKTEWARLADHAERIGGHIVREKYASRRQADVQSAALSAPGDGQTILILERTLNEQLEAVRQHDCPLDLRIDDLAVFALAREVYALECDRIGRPPRDPWIDELGRHEFTRTLLGLPFSPLVFQLIL